MVSRGMFYAAPCMQVLLATLLGACAKPAGGGVRCRARLGHSAGRCRPACIGPWLGAQRALLRRWRGKRAGGSAAGRADR